MIYMSRLVDMMRRASFEIPLLKTTRRHASAHCAFVCRSTPACFLAYVLALKMHHGLEALPTDWYAQRSLSNAKVCLRKCRVTHAELQSYRLGRACSCACHNSVVNILVSCQHLSLIFRGIFLVELSGFIVQRTGTADIISIVNSLPRDFISYLFGSPSRLCRLRRTVWTL